MNPGYPPYPQQPMPQPGNYPGYPTTTSQAGVTTSAPYPSQAGINPNYPQQAGIYPPQPGYPSQAGYPPQQHVPYPPQSGYPPAPVSAYPPAPGASYPPMPAAPYPATTGPSPYPPQPSYPQNSYPPQSAPAPSYPPNPAAGNLYPTQPMHSAPTANYPTHGSDAMKQTFVNQSYGNPSHAPPPSHSAGYPSSTAGYGAGVAQQERPTPTVIPVSPFNPQADADILRKAMKGIGTDEKAIINVLTKRSNQQRVEIAHNFKAMYGKDLIANLKSELSGKFEDLIVAMMTPLTIFLASEIRDAIEGFGTNEKTLVEILCTASNAEINAIKAAYQKVYGTSLENDLSGDTSGNFRRLLVSLVQGRRSENYVVDEVAASRDAQALMAAGVLMIGTDESTFNAILCSRSYPQLRRVFMEYQRLAGKPLEHAIKREFSGNIEDGLLAIIQSVEDKPGFFAERIRDAVACAGTKDRQLIRVVVSRCEIDMQSIKRAYQLRYGKSMEQAISDDTSGDYKKALLALVSGGY